jgi:hypothetical protein
MWLLGRRATGLSWCGPLLLWADVLPRKRLIRITLKQNHIATCGVVVCGSWLECQWPKFEPFGFTIFFGKFWSTLWSPTCGAMCWWGPHVGPCAGGPTCGTMHMWGPHVGPCTSGAHMWDQALVGPCDGGNPNPQLHVVACVGPDPCFLFSSCFITITLLFCDASLLSSLVPHEQNWNDSSVTK